MRLPQSSGPPGALIFGYVSLRLIRQTYGFSHRAGKMVRHFVGLLFSLRIFNKEQFMNTENLLPRQETAPPHELGSTILAGQLLTTQEVAELLHIHKNCLRKMVKYDGLPAYRCGRQFRFSHDGLIDWVRGLPAN